MTTWYLIVILSGIDGGQPSSQQTIQFQNERACVVVRDELKERYGEHSHVWSTNNYFECRKDN